MVIASNNNHPLQWSNEYMSREDIDVIMQQFMLQVSQLENKIYLVKDYTKWNTQSILDSNI